MLRSLILINLFFLTANTLAADCPIGTILSPNGDCIRCGIDQFFIPRSFQCVPCPPGTGAPSGFALYCLPCREVFKKPILGSSCLPQNFRFYELDDGRGNCPPGTGKPSVRPFLCTPCNRGTFKDTTGPGSCQACPPNSIAPEFGTSKCLPCPAGTAPSFGVRCEQPNGCLQKTIQIIDQTGTPRCQDTTCDPRPAFELFLTTRKPGCNRCIGEGVAGGPFPCTPCPIDQISTDGVQCKSCPDSQVRSNYFGAECACKGELSVNVGLVDGVCQQCPPGSFGKLDRVRDVNVCQKCPAGTFRNFKSVQDITSCIAPRCITADPCLNCPPGFFTDREGAVECKPCPPGSYTNGAGETFCIKRAELQSLMLDPNPTPNPLNCICFGR